MNSELESPFVDQKWESDTEKLIWLPPIFQQWEGKKCLYITGSRGTGKTTLLQGLVWDQRISNESIKNQIISKDPFSKKYIGVYLNIPDWNAKHFVNWPPKDENSTNEEWEEERAAIFSLYLEYGILENLILAIQSLRSRNVIKFTPQYEANIIKKIIRERWEIEDFFKKDNRELNLTELRLYFKRMYETIRKCARKHKLLEPENEYPSLQMGKYLEEVSNYLLLLCSEERERSDINIFTNNKWTLKVCLDSMESFYHYQQKAINTIVARRQNISFVIASLDGFIDINSTYIHEHSLTDADRIHYPLDKIYGDQHSTKFDEFINEVAKLRMKSLVKDYSIELKLKNIAGVYTLNELLHPIILKSQKIEIKKFINEAKKFTEEWAEIEEQIKKHPTQNIADNSKMEISKNKEIPAYLEYYLVKKLHLILPSKDQDVEEIRSFISQNFRKKQVAALLCFCKEYSQKVPFAGYAIIKAMSDGCIRDFLAQTHEIYVEQKLPPEKFAEKRIPLRKQFNALSRASESRFNGITNKNEEYSNEVQRLVEALGEITANNQSDYSDNASALKTIEKGKYYLNFDLSNTEEKEKITQIIHSARHTCCIKVLDEQKNERNELINLTFRLHNLFAPKFEYSYRGAQESKTELNAKDLIKICETKNSKERKRLIEQISQKIIRKQRKETHSDDSNLHEWIGGE